MVVDVPPLMISSIALESCLIDLIRENSYYILKQKHGTDVLIESRGEHCLGHNISKYVSVVYTPFFGRQCKTLKYELEDVALLGHARAGTVVCGKVLVQQSEVFIHGTGGEGYGGGVALFHIVHQNLGPDGSPPASYTHLTLPTNTAV